TSLCSSAVTGAKVGLPGLKTDKSKGPLEGADNDLHPLGVKQTQSSHQDLSPATALNIPLEVDSQPFHSPSCIQPCSLVSFVFQTRAGNPIKMDENLEEPQVATQAPLKTFQTPLKGLINNTVPKPIRKDHFHMVDESIFGFTTGHGKQITPPYEESVKRALELSGNGLLRPLLKFLMHTLGSSSALSDLPSIQLVSDRKAISHTNLETNGKLGMIRIREQTEDVFNVQAGSSVHTRALNNSKRFQSLEAVDKDFTPTRKGSQLDESTSSNFKKNQKRTCISSVQFMTPAQCWLNTFQIE
ncbi:hypothetical protein PPACK8108_LOCUS18529, partial [Phakopsora pachyrhizi]